MFLACLAVIAVLKTGQKLIFLVEDDVGIRSAIDIALSDVAGFKVCSFSDPVVAFEAIEYLHTNGPSPDLIITDIWMPDDGVLLVKKLDELGSKIPILPISAGNMKQIEGRKVLKKPFSIDVLIDEVRLLIAD